MLKSYFVGNKFYTSYQMSAEAYIYLMENGYTIEFIDGYIA